MNRREFGASLAGIVVAFSMAPAVSLAAEGGRGMPAMLANNRRLDAWLRIDPVGTVTVYTGRVELGQGNTTALAQIVADELDVTLERVRMIPVDTMRSPNEGTTAGSNSIEAGGAALRAASAEARAIVLKRAGERLSASADTLIVNDGIVTARDAAGRISYWELAGEVSLRQDATGTATPKPPSAHKVVGTAAQRIDIPGKVAGEPIYVHDMRLPGMVFGRVVRPPSNNSQLVSIDQAKIAAMPGVIQVVRNGRFLAVVAEREEQAIDARDALVSAARWRVPPDLPDPARVHDHLKSLSNDTQTVNEKTGSAGAAVKTHTATYRKPYLAHASIGPSCAVAGLVDNVWTVWSHTQGPYPLRGDLAKVAGLPVERVRVIHAQGAGCYGHNGADDVALDALLMSVATQGRIVKVQWMRDDEFGWEPFGSAMEMSVRADLDVNGAVTDWQYDVWTCPHNMRPGNPRGMNLLAAGHLAMPFARPKPVEAALPGGGGDRNAVPCYEFPNQKIVDHFITEMPLRTSALRTLGAFGNVFAHESFMDELAHLAGADPVAFRLKHLVDERGRAVLEAAAKKAGWQEGARSDGTRGRGVAYSRYETIKAYVAVVVDVTVDRGSGAVKVDRVTAAVDAGQMINTDGITNQIEGGIIQGTSWTLKEQVKFDRETIKTRDWVSYPILSFPEVPAVDVVLLDRPEQRSLGAGEASQGPTPAAIANAIFHATGARLRELPFTPERVKAAIQQG
jgi:xanthine dehydrogenase molybdopterin-binding subunit B